MHCSSCAAKGLTARHDSINHAIARTFTAYGIAYTKEPRQLPRKNVSEYHKIRSKDGPDGLLNAFDGITVVEIHCSHTRLYHSPNSDQRQYDQVGCARALKKHNYKDYANDYPGIKWTIMSVSSGGVIHPASLEWVKKQVLPLASFRQGQGLMRMLKNEVALAVAKGTGMLFKLAKLQKNIM